MVCNSVPIKSRFPKFKYRIAFDKWWKTRKDRFMRLYIVCEPSSTASVWVLLRRLLNASNRPLGPGAPITDIFYVLVLTFAIVSAHSAFSPAEPIWSYELGVKGEYEGERWQIRMSLSNGNFVWRMDVRSYWSSKLYDAIYARRNCCCFFLACRLWWLFSGDEWLIDREW